MVSPDGQRLGYGELVAGDMLHVQAQPQSKLKDPATFKVMGQPVPRVDIPAKVTGGAAYVQDMRLPGMVHARVVRPPSYGAQLTACDTAAIEKMPGVVKVVRDGNFLAVVARKEFQAIKAMRALSAAAKWKETREPAEAGRSAACPHQPAVAGSRPSSSSSNPSAVGTKTIEATYTRPYQSHGSIGPSCAVAQSVDDADDGLDPHPGRLSRSPGHRRNAARAAGEAFALIHVEGSGCYGHNGADDAAADAALIARALPGVPVRVQWMREQEHAWEPFGPAMVTKLKASLDGNGTIADWNFEVWSNTHSMRPGGAGSMLAAQHMAQPFAVPAPKPMPMPEGGGDRNAIPIYKFPNAHVVHHFLPAMPVRISAMRALGAYHNVFSIESFMDELAIRGRRRSRRIQAEASRGSARARCRSTRRRRALAGRRASKPPQGRGFGFAFARYKNLAAYCAVATEVEVNRETGRPRLVRAVAAVDSGQVVNPDGLINQIEGAIMQSMSWTLYESRHLQRYQDHQHRLADLSDPALQCRSRQHRGAYHQPARPAVPRQRRNRAGAGGGLDRQRHRQRHRKAAAQSAADAQAHQGRDRCVTIGFSEPIPWLTRKDRPQAAGAVLWLSIPVFRSVRDCSRHASRSTVPRRGR